MWFWKRWKIKKWEKCVENPSRNILVPITHPNGVIEWKKMTFGEYKEFTFPKLECNVEDPPVDDWLDDQEDTKPEDLT